MTGSLERGASNLAHPLLRRGEIIGGLELGGYSIISGTRCGKGTRSVRINSKSYNNNKIFTKRYSTC